jgi:hypothetical protein
MKLASPMVERTLEQFEAEVIPDGHPATAQLTQLFGEHTFFLDNNGLNIVEPADSSRAGEPTWTVVKLASWTDPGRTSLTPHNPEPTNLTIGFDRDDLDGQI